MADVMRVHVVTLVVLALAFACGKDEEKSGQNGGDASASDARTGEKDGHSPGDIARPEDLPVSTGPVTVSTTKGMKVTTVGSHLFSMNTETQEFELPVRGSRKSKLFGVLAAQDGRRKVVVREGDEEQVIFPADWILPGVGALSDGGELAVCVNRLSGSATIITKGSMPDPTGGLGLVCRLSREGQWLGAQLLSGKGEALWLRDVVARPGGLRRGGLWCRDNRAFSLSGVMLLHRPLAAYPQKASGQ